MTTELLERPTEDDMVVTDDDGDDEPDHICCICSPHISLCGAYIEDPNMDVYQPGDPICEDCETVAFEPCPRCNE